ncbi:Pentapeptide repeats (9 copies) [Actinoalloteichus sp. GBA129-24]|uniref:Pentapeptide repeats (9 copies) n=1 Tax=Actinoalloteichus fjordicus TaxID=1612552 RepID=A0AAC9PT06_9PSEU|nr:Pentapeptide repeats (9 copies) [Actinoalloteichus fjordicus]APU22207.1 Pentapeptide repeats (9 copies) [Actinoalloteichus sp. GBA129-24]
MVACCAALVLAAGFGLGGWGWQRAAQLTGNDRVAAQNEAVRTGLTAAGGVGAALALLLAFRRQRATEAAAEETRYDAAERRVTELQLKAVEQLGSDQAPVRLGGLHALDRLGDGSPEHRQTVIDLLCAYLRMPFLEPGLLPPDPTAEQIAEDQERAQERVVRLTAQRLLADRLRGRDRSNAAGPANPRHWPGEFDIDLSRANLINLDFEGCVFGRANFSTARFLGQARFGRAVFTGDAWFTKAEFTSDAAFPDVVFAGFASFDTASFRGDTQFVRTRFTGSAGFAGASFHKPVSFLSPTFQGAASFSSTVFPTHEEVSRSFPRTVQPVEPVEFLDASVRLDGRRHAVWLEDVPDESPDRGR